IPTQIRMAVVGQRRDISPRETREPLHRTMGLQARVLQPTLVNATKWHPIRTLLMQWHRYPKSPNRIAGYRIGSDQSAGTTSYLARPAPAAHAGDFCLRSLKR